MSQQQYPSSVEVTLENCSDEPIRVPGSIQQHGFFLAVDHDSQKIVIASENAERYLEVPIRLVLGASLDSVLPREIVQALNNFQNTRQPEQISHYLGSFMLKGELYSVVTHKVGGRSVLELEKQERLVGAEMMNGVITNFVGLLSKVKGSAELCDAIAHQVSELTGFDRIMVYSFDETGAGTVVSEVNNGNLPSCLGLRFPGTDIPQQARDLYVLNTVRIIPDANYEPSPLIGIAGEDARGFDLSLATLRSVSPIHLQYMRNMGTISSMSLSIVLDGKLWGLISGHHARQHHVPYLIRSACDMLSKLVGTQLSSFRNSERFSRELELNTVQRGLLTHIAVEQNYISALGLQTPTLMRIADADGVAIWLGDHSIADGRTPDDTQIARLVAWLDERQEDVFSSSNLSAEIPWANEFSETASGMIAIRISDVNSRYVLWFRPEVVQTVRWAGEPTKEVEPGQSLSPRTSFEAWKETVRGTSKKWTEVEIKSAADFRAALLTVSLRSAEEEALIKEARFQQLTQTLPTKIFTADENGKLIYVNNRWKDSGLTAKGLWFEGGNVHFEDLARCRAAWRHAVETGSDLKEEIRFCEHPNKTRWTFVHAVPYKRRHERKAAGWVASCIDLTEQREREAAARITDKLALTGRISSVMAHEVNNPLESITNLMYLLRSEVSTSGPAMEYLTMAEGELHRISGITKQTLLWDRDNSTAPETGNLGTIAEEVLRLFQGKIRNRQVTVRTDIAGVSYYGITSHVRQVVSNLVLNAVDAARVGGNVWIEGREENGHTVLKVVDDGIGMDEFTRSQVFKPFFSTKGDLGNGLGLYISQDLIERHGGKIEIESRPAAGTTVVVRLPLTQPTVVSVSR